MIATWFVVGMGSSMSALAEPLNSAISNKKPTQKETLSVVLTGQALIQSDIRKGWPDAIADIQPLLEGDVVFTNFESMILQADDSMTNLPPYNTGHYGPPEMLDVLAQMGFNLIATANNHGYDLFEKGVMNVIDNLNERDLVYSGTGVNVQKATEAGYLNTPKGRVALVSMATGAIREGGNEVAVWGGVTRDGDRGAAPVFGDAWVRD